MEKEKNKKFVITMAKDIIIAYCKKMTISELCKIRYMLNEIIKEKKIKRKKSQFWKKRFKPNY